MLLDKAYEDASTIHDSDEEDEEYRVIDPLLGLESLSFIRRLLVPAITTCSLCVSLAISALAVLALAIGRLSVRWSIDRDRPGSRGVHGLVLVWRRGLPAHWRSLLERTTRCHAY